MRWEARGSDRRDMVLGTDKVRGPASPSELTS